MANRPNYFAFFSQIPHLRRHFLSIMWQTVVISVLFVALAAALLAVRIICVKGGQFPKTHISQQKAMRDRGITCVQSQDYEARHRQGLYADSANRQKQHTNHHQ